MAIPFTSSFNQTIAFSDTDAQFNLATNTAQTYTVPGNATQKFILTFGLPSTANCWVGYNVTATVPASNTQTATSGLEFIVPGMQRYAIGGDVLSLKSSDTSVQLGLSIRQIPS